MKKRELIQSLMQRIEELERRVAMLEARFHLPVTPYEPYKISGGGISSTPIQMDVIQRYENIIDTNYVY